jgi:hypothetical protein
MLLLLWLALRCRKSSLNAVAPARHELTQGMDNECRLYPGLVNREGEFQATAWATERFA